MKEMPITVKRSIELLGIILTGILISVGNSVVTPLVMAFFVSLVLLPVYRFFKRIRFPEALAILFSILLLIVIVALVGWFFSFQIGKLVQDFPQIKNNITTHLTTLSQWVNAKTNFSTQEQLNFLNDQSNKLLNYAGGLLSGAALSLTSVLIFVGLLPIYIFLLLYYKNLLLRFVFLWFPQSSHGKVEEVMREIQSIIKSYLVGLCIQITYITILLGGILLVIGIHHAILIGIIFAILNLIPYVGAFIGNLIGVLLTLTSSQELWPIFAVLGSITVVQFLDNNILMPRIVGSKVKINALATIVGVIVAGNLAGVAGMFLSLPVIAVLKIVFDRTENFRQWGVLLGDERPHRSPMTFPGLRLRSKRARKKLEKENDIKPPEEK